MIHVDSALAEKLYAFEPSASEWRLIIRPTNTRAQMSLVQNVIQAIRSIDASRGEKNIHLYLPSLVDVLLLTDDDVLFMVGGKTGVADIYLWDTPLFTGPLNSSQVRNTRFDMFVFSEGSRQSTARKKLDLKAIEAQIENLRARLANPSFVNKAPAQVIDGARKQLSQLEEIFERECRTEN